MYAYIWIWGMHNNEYIQRQQWIPWETSNAQHNTPQCSTQHTAMLDTWQLPPCLWVTQPTILDVPLCLWHVTPMWLHLCHSLCLCLVCHMCVCGLSLCRLLVEQVYRLLVSQVYDVYDMCHSHQSHVYDMCQSHQSHVHHMCQCLSYVSCRWYVWVTPVPSMSKAHQTRARLLTRYISLSLYV